MVPLAFVRQYAVGQGIGVDVADQEIVLHYMLRLLCEEGLTGRLNNEEPGPLLFKGGTALRKCIFGQMGRFSRDIDMDATDEDGFEAAIERVLTERSPFYNISFAIADFRYSVDGNFSGNITYQHENGNGNFELQISYRLCSILNPVDLRLIGQTYFQHVEFSPPLLYGLDPYEMIAEKIMACNRRRGGSGKDVYDLFLWSNRPFNHNLVRRVAVLKAWTDQRRTLEYDPAAFLEQLSPRNYQWKELQGLVPQRFSLDIDEICDSVRTRFAFLVDCTTTEGALLADQISHREHTLFEELRNRTQNWSH